MTWLGLAAIIVGLLLIRQPVILVLAVATAYIHVFMASGQLEFLAQDIWFAIDREILLSIPMFMLAGAIMTRGTIARRLIRVMSSLTAAIPGGLGVAAILSCAAFAAISGSSIVTMLAIGSIMYPALIQTGYPKNFALGATMAGGTLGIIIPPSIPMILYGVMTETSITDLFAAGFGPGLILTAVMATYSAVMCRNIRGGSWDGAEIVAALKDGILALLMPVILLGGIYSGYFTPTESAAVALVYSILVEVFFYRELKAADYYKVFEDTTKLLGTLLMLLAIAGSLNTILDYQGVPKAMAAYITETFQNRWMFMLAVNILLLTVGCFMDIGSAILILAPLLLPVAQANGFDAIHFGIIMIVNLEIGYLTPPVGLNLWVAMIAFKQDFATVIRAAIPFVVLMMAVLIPVIIFPEISHLFVKTR
jgi:C4-dicarboxylate transporter DctM subunit